MGDGLRVCKRCLLYEQSAAYSFEDLENYIRNLDPEVCVPQDVYEERLAICSGCEKQLGRMCRLCGCYVELRAALKVRKCPDVPAKWDRWDL